MNQTTPSAVLALDVLHHVPSPNLHLRAGDAIHPVLQREWSGSRDYCLSLILANSIMCVDAFAIIHIFQHVVLNSVHKEETL